jgi:hypothetical protein
MKQLTTLYRLSLALLLAASVAACGTDSSGSGGGSSASGTSGFSLRVTDAAFDKAAIVELTFTKIALKRADGGLITIPFENLSASTIDLAQLQGTKSEELVGDFDVPPGVYTELRLFVDQSKSKLVETGGAEFPLKIPSGRLMVKGDFTVSDTLPTLLIVDVDLHRSIKWTGMFYNMQNPVLRLVKDGNFGHARGMLDALLFSAPNCSDPMTFNSIYVFEGHVSPDDIDNIDPEPITTSRVAVDPSSGLFEYEAAFLPEGDYTISFTCDQDELDKSEDLNFFGTQNITIKVNDILFL